MGSLLNKNITVKINWCLENIVPPVMREWKWFMYLIIYPAYGNKTKYVMEFRDRYPFMTQDEISDYYRLIADAPVNKKRKIDLTNRGIQYVLENIVGESVLDAACGRGLLAKQISKRGYTVSGLDIVVPDKGADNESSKIQFHEGRLQALPFGENSFDTVVCTHALEHIPEYQVAIRELVRVAAKRVIIVIPCQREYHYSADLHVNFVPYLYRFKAFIGVPSARYEKIGKEFMCIIDKTGDNFSIEYG